MKYLRKIKLKKDTVVDWLMFILLVSAIALLVIII